MSYFSNFPRTYYLFGDADNKVSVFPALSSYANVVDKFKLDEQSYLNYNIIDGDRPDVLSAKLYGDQKYYWTLYLMNEHIRRQGWPLSYAELVQQVKDSYPHTTLVFRTDGSGTGHVGHTDPVQNIIQTFKVGSRLQGLTSGATGTVIRKDLDLGQIIISGSSGSWQNGEVVYFNRVTENPAALLDPNPTVAYEGVTVYEHAILKSSSSEFLSAHHYENAAGEWVDIDPAIETQSAFIVEKTHFDTVEEQNNKLKIIKVLRADRVDLVFNTFNSLMGG